MTVSLLNDGITDKSIKLLFRHFCTKLHHKVEKRSSHRTNDDDVTRNNQQSEVQLGLQR